MGMARLGDKKSPMLRGGGVAFGPKPRDFSTDLPKKIYDLAWRIALSYRYRRGELLVVDKVGKPEDPRVMYLDNVFQQNRWGKGEGRSLLITNRKNEPWAELFEQAGRHGKIRSSDEVDVKNLLEMGRLIIEKSALDRILRSHQSDLVGLRSKSQAATN
jgi:large subunit ribosomal protein L4